MVSERISLNLIAKTVDVKSLILVDSEGDALSPALTNEHRFWKIYHKNKKIFEKTIMLPLKQWHKDHPPYDKDGKPITLEDYCGVFLKYNLRKHKLKKPNTKRKRKIKSTKRK